MSSTPSDDDREDARVLQAAREYLADLEAGRAPNRAVYLARHPDLAGALVECFDGIDLAHGAACAMAPLAPLQPEPATGTLGDFQIVRELGRGGMGIVYEAVQLSLGRRVALKVLPFAAGLDAKHLQRFRNEAHAAAALHHTNIVPVHAVGCERGVHFYAMQLIDGRPLDLVIRELRSEGQAPAKVGGTTVDLRGSVTAGGSASVHSVGRSERSRESYRTAARIAAQVADALEYAHNAGVVHRDIKPANLLLDPRGTVWVTDFGLAQVCDVSLTRTGEVLGTLRYMSPEQAAGRVLVDHRTDVYSLGATVYELLTLQPIFAGQDRRALLHQILEEEPRPLRQIDRSIPIELETIVLKALAKAPEERYATAGEMAADLRRFLDERPILARRPSLLERARKWTRRHPAIVASAFVVLAFFVVGLATATALVWREKALTHEAYARERQRADEAEKHLQLAQDVADDLIRVAEDEVPDDPRLQGLRKRLLEIGLEYYQAFIEQRREDPSAQAKLNLTRERVEKIVADLAVLQGIGELDLLKSSAVLDDLRVTAKQRASIGELSARRDEQRETTSKTSHALTEGQRRDRFLEEARSNDAAVRVILQEQQRHRLRQIALQVRGISAFQEPEVLAALRLNAEQRTRIRGIEADLFRPRPPPGSPPGPKGKGDKPPPPDRPPPGFLAGTLNKMDEQAWQRWWDEVAQKRKAALVSALAVLTKEQRARWHEMTGEPFTGSIPFFQHGPFRLWMPGR
jgi:serine/threonine protein kinase